MMEAVLRADRTEGPPRKRILTDTNPNPNPNPNPNKSFVSTSPESTVSSDSSSDRLSKKTRDLVNLSDCHGCGVRISYTNPRERLQPMNSMWRIVLLCKNCTKRVNSSELCPYCFTLIGEEECFKCRDCQHYIHQDCVKGFDSRLVVSVCVDCWVPDAFVSSVRARKRKFRNSVINRNPNPNEPNSVAEEVERKVVAAAKGSENALMKAVVAKNAVELAKGVLSVVSGRKAVEGCEKEVVDDAELVFLLHRAINSSPRISRYACLGSSVGGDDASVTCYSRRRAGKDASSLDVPLICYSRRRVKGCFKNEVSLNPSLLCYSRRRCFNDNNCKENDVGRMDMKPHRYLLKYCRIGKGKSRPSLVVNDSANLYTEGITHTRDFGNGNECHEVCEKVDNSNRFLLKYKRISRSKPEIRCKIEELSRMLPSNHSVESTTLFEARTCPSS